MRKFLCAVMAAMMVMLACGAALAGEGDRALVSAGFNESNTGYLRETVVIGKQAYFFMAGVRSRLMVADLEAGTLEEYSMDELDERLAGVIAAEGTEEAPAEGTEDAPADGEKSEEPREVVSENIVCWFPMNGEICALLTRSIYNGQENRIDGGHVRRMVLADGKVDLEAEDALQLDWSGMTETMGSWTSSKSVSYGTASGNNLYLLVYEDGGNQMLVRYDLSTGEMTETDANEVNDIFPAPEGRLLVSRYNWSESLQMICVFDPETESMEELARQDISNSSGLSGVAWDQAKDILYYVYNGEIFAAPGRDMSQAQAVNDCPSDMRMFSYLLEDGRLLVYGSNAAYLRNTDPALRSATTLRIRPYTWTSGLNSAIFGFSSQRSDISLIQENYGDENTLLQAMMNRDSQVDVYMMSLDSTVFSALFDRGFLADLSADAKLTEAVDKMYPFVKEALTKDGKLLAIPQSASGEVMGYSLEGLEKLGIALEDLPRTWEQFFRFLEELPDRLAGTGARAFNIYTTQEELRVTMLNMVMQQYMLSHPEEPMNTPLMRNLLDQIQHFNYEALGVLSDEDLDRIEEQGIMDDSNAGVSLMNLYSGVTISYWDDGTPVTLALEEGEEPILPFHMDVAFVNPYTEHPAEAMEFMECLMDNLPTDARYSLIQGLTEPLRAPNHEDMKKNLEKWLRVAKQNLEAADDEETRETLEKTVAEYEQQLAEYDENNWMISPKDIEYYQTRTAYLKPITWDYYQALSANEGGEQFWSLRQGYQTGTTPAAELLSFIDKKIQMMRLEGN